MRSLAVVLPMIAAAAGCSNVVDDTPRPVVDAAPAWDAPVFPDGPTLPPLRVDYLDPDHGSFAGGTEVILRGRGFVEGMSVTIGGRAVDSTDVEVLDGNRAIVVTPPGEPGDADLELIAGPHATTRENAYLYEPIYVDPASGGNSGGTYVRVRGLGTSFKATDVVTFGGAPMTGMVVVNGQELTGYTPPGVSGAVDVRIAGADGGGELFAEDGYTYDATVGNTFGGMSGGPIDGALNLRLIDAYTEDGIGMAVAVIGDPETSTLWGITDPFGQLTLSGPGLRGPVTLTAGHERYESGAMVGFDARNVTMFLAPLPPDPDEIPPPSGPFPPGRSPGVVSGDVVFGGTTGIGTSDWDLVPEPTTDTARKRTYVFTTAPSIFSSSADPGPGGTIDYVPGQSSWQYQIPVRPTAFALVAIAGLWEPEIDPDGSGPLPKGVFTPYAMGVQRNILVGPGEQLENVSITINIPLDTGLKVLLPDAPAVAPALEGVARGPDEYRVNVILDLGGEGVIRLPGSRAVFRDRRSTILTGLAPLAFAISDASYTIAAGAYTAGAASPYSIRILRGVRDLGRPVTVDGFVGVPRPRDPAPGGVTTSRRLLVELEGGGVAPTIRDYRLINLENGHPVWRVLARGDLDEVPLYDLGRFGLPAMTTDELFFSAYAVKIPGAGFDTFNYGQLNANYWGAYAYDTFSVSFARP